MEVKVVLLLFLLCLITIAVSEPPKYAKPEFVNNIQQKLLGNIKKNELSMASKLADNTSPHIDCTCIGVKSITFKYTDTHEGKNKNVKILALGEADPFQFDHVEDGEKFTIFGTFTENKLLGPIEVTLKLFEPYTPNTHPFETQKIDVKCPDVVKEGDTFGSITVVNVVVHKEGKKCPKTNCPYKVAVCVDSSGYVTVPSIGGNPLNEYTIKNSLKTEIIDYFSGYDIHLALYSYATNAYENMKYTSLKDTHGVNKAKHAIDDIKFYKNSPTWYSNWDELFKLVKNRGHDTLSDYPDVIIFITGHYPTVHSMSPYVEDEYGDDISAAINSAHDIKSNGKTKIIAIGVGDSVRISNIQAISGPIAKKDYFLYKEYQNLNKNLHDNISPYVCCESDKDDCGVCYGDNKSCKGCDGVPNSGKEFDVCGICGGNGTQCVPPPCNHEANVTVVEHTYFDIIPHKDYGVFEFIYHTNYLPGSAVVLGFSEYEPCKLRKRGTCDNRVKDYNTKYCDLFTVNFPSNKWIKEVDEAKLKVYYRANFTLHDLLYCKDTHGKGGLIKENKHGKGYHGTLYGAVVKPNDCYDETKCEKIIFQTHYKFEIWLENEGVLSSMVMVSPIKIEAKWLRNIWLQKGDVIVEFETSINQIEQIHPKDKSTILSDAEILVDHETGIPFHLVYVNTTCEVDDDDDDYTHTPNSNTQSTHFHPHSVIDPTSTNKDRCRQLWRLRTYGGIGVLDFSGFKPIRFNVLVNGHSRVQVKVNLELTIKRSTDPKVDSMLGANLQIFQDRELTNPYFPTGLYNNSFIDCSDVFALAFLKNQTVKLWLEEIFLCVGRTGNPLPYEPSNPHNTGCNTPYVDMLVIQLYNKKHNFTNDIYKFEFIHDPPSELFEVGFKYEARALSKFKQLLQVHWRGEIKHYNPKRSLRELPRYASNSRTSSKLIVNKKPIMTRVNSMAKKFKKIEKQIIEILHDQIINHDNYDFNYDKTLYMRPFKYISGTETPQNLKNGLITQEQVFGSEENYLYNPANSVNCQSYNVRCAYGYTWYQGRCTNTFYTYAHHTGTNFYLWVFLVFIFICVLVYYCYSVPSTSIISTPQSTSECNDHNTQLHVMGESFATTTHYHKKPRKPHPY